MNQIRTPRRAAVFNPLGVSGHRQANAVKPYLAVEASRMLAQLVYSRCLLRSVRLTLMLGLFQLSRWPLACDPRQCWTLQWKWLHQRQLHACEYRTACGSRPTPTAWVLRGLRPWFLEPEIFQHNWAATLPKPAVCKTYQAWRVELRSSWRMIHLCVCVCWSSYKVLKLDIYLMSWTTWRIAFVAFWLEWALISVYSFQGYNGSPKKYIATQGKDRFTSKVYTLLDCSFTLPEEWMIYWEIAYGRSFYVLGMLQMGSDAGTAQRSLSPQPFGQHSP